MDPYLALTRRARYPAVLLDVGLNDSRVAPWSSGKYGGPLIFRTDSDSGHFGTSLSQEAAQEAHLYTFVEKALGTASSASRTKAAH